MIVGPTLNAFFELSKTLLIRKLFPVLYLPTTETIAIFLLIGIDFRNVYASGLRINEELEYEIKGME